MIDIRDPVRDNLRVVHSFFFMQRPASQGPRLTLIENGSAEGRRVLERWRVRAAHTLHSNSYQSKLIDRARRAVNKTSLNEAFLNLYYVISLEWWHRSSVGGGSLAHRKRGPLHFVQKFKSDHCL